MRLRAFAAVLITALAAGTGTALAQTTVIEREEPTVVVRERPATVIERREPVEPPLARDCESETVTRSDGAGNSTTVRRESCD